MFKRILSIFSVIFLLLSINCFNSPTQPNGQKALDCSNPTIPKAADTTAHTGLFVSAICEIYDFEQRLVAYGPLSVDSNNRVRLYFNWDGKDMNGKSVDPGKYIVKTSVFDNEGKSECNCMETYIAPGK
jgi:hypothetical protein